MSDYDNWKTNAPDPNETKYKMCEECDGEGVVYEYFTDKETGEEFEDEQSCHVCHNDGCVELTQDELDKLVP